MSIPALVISILVIVALVIVFVTTFVIYHRTPTPKGCEEYEINENNCANCQQAYCPVHKKEREEVK